MRDLGYCNASCRTKCRQGMNTRPVIMRAITYGIANALLCVKNVYWRAERLCTLFAPVTTPTLLYAILSARFGNDRR